MKKRIFLAGFLLITLSLFVGCTFSTLPVEDWITSMINQAAQRVVAQFPTKAVFFAEALGSVPGGSGVTKDEITLWTFTFNYQDLTGSASVLWNGGVWGTPVGSGENIPDVAYLTIPVNVYYDLAEAIELLKTAGFVDAFKVVDFFQPSVPGNTEPFYIFSFEEQQGGVIVIYQVTVGAISGEVEQLP